MASARPALTPSGTNTRHAAPNRRAPQATLRPWLPLVAQHTVTARAASAWRPDSRSAVVACGASPRRASSDSSALRTA